MNAAAVLPPLFNRRSAGGFVELVLLGLLQAVSLIGTALLLRQLFGGDSLLPGVSTWESIGLLALLGLVAAGARWRERLVSEALAVDYVHGLRLQLFDAAMLGAARPGLGLQMVRFSGDLSAIRQWVSLGCARAISSSLFIAGLLTALILIHPPIALAVGAVLGLAVGLAILIGLRLERAVALLRKSRGGLANKVSEALTHLPTILANGRAGKERRRLERAGLRLNDRQLRRANWQGLLRASIDASHRLCLVLIVALGLAGFGSGVAFADLLAMFAVVSLMTTPVRDLGRVYEYWKNYKVARANLRPLLAQLEPGESPPARLRTGAGALRFVGGPIGATLHIDEMRVEPGARIALCGDNGSGKSTLLHAIAGHERRRGQQATDVYLDGALTRRLTDRDRRKAIGIAANETRLVDGSISKNLRYRLPGVSCALLERACQDAGLNPMLARLPDGIMTRIGKGRQALSQGQAARIKLARAIVGSPRLLLLDEIEQGMDSAGKRRLASLIEAYPGSVIYATHDDELTRLASQVWTLRNGEIRVERNAQDVEAVA